MKKISLISDGCTGNNIFDINKKVLNRDDCLYFFFLLKKKLSEQKIDLSTSDINSLESSCAAFYFDISDRQKVQESSLPKYLFLFESEVIKPKGWRKPLQENFDKIFTWNDELVDNKTYFKMNFTHKFPLHSAWSDSYQEFENKKLCANISGNKIVYHPLELYTERVKAIKWFEQNHPEDFDLFGVGWDFPASKFKIAKLFFRLIRNFGVMPKLYLSYKGKVESKNQTLRNYKFAICYENAKDIPGYITEKIFDCFFAGCVPIYWGAPNVLEHIPKQCFIDRRKFSSYENLYKYLSTMPKEEYLKYISAIEQFIFSDNKAIPFKAEEFVKTVIEHVKNDIQ